MEDIKNLLASEPLAIATAAVTANYFERECPFQGQSVINLGEPLEHHPNGVSFMATSRTATVLTYALQDVIFDANTLLLRKDGRVIAETDYFVPNSGGEPGSGRTVVTPPSENESFIVGYNNVHWAYQHWLTQCLPAIDWSLRMTRTRSARLLLPALQPWQEKFLELLGHAGVPRLTPDPGALYRLRHAEFCGFLNGSTSFEVSQALRVTIHRILRAAPSQPSPHRVLFVRNPDPYYGSIRNEAAVIELLRQHGVTIVEPERLGTLERINLFRQADAIIGSMGQYLADVVFCRPGALLWEWMPRHHQNHSFNRLAQAAEVDYWGDLFENTGDQRSAGEWEIDIDVVSRRLAQLGLRGSPLVAARALPDSNDQSSATGDTFSSLAAVAFSPVDPAPAPSTTNRPPPRSVSIADIAEATVCIEREGIFYGHSVISLGDALVDHPNHVSFLALGTTVTMWNYTLRDVVLDGKTLLLLKDGEIIPETDYFAPAYDPADAPRSSPLGENEVLIFGCNNVHFDYQHWLTQCLPAIDWSLRQTRSRKVRLLLPDLLPWQEDFLRLLGYADVPRFRPHADARYHLPQVEFSDFLNGSSSFGISLNLLATVQRILDATPSQPSPDKILFIRNADPYYGRIRNEDAVVALLRRHGVAIVEPDSLGTVECINLFRNADVVIGPLGRYLASVVFCRPGALLWEWMPRHQQNHSINCLAKAAQIDYWGDLFETCGDPAKPGEWEVDPGIVERRFRDLSARLAAAPSAARAQPAVVHRSTSLDKLVLRFESLGDNCEFGLVQRKAGAEPLGLFRFNGIRVPPHERLEKLVAGLECRFERLGEPGTIVMVSGEIELFVSETIYDFWFHTGIVIGNADLAAEVRRQERLLKFLRRKLFEDLESGDKIMVWRSLGTTNREQVQPLLDILRRLGPNTLLWVTESDADHPSGTVEELEADFLKGYVRHLGASEHLGDIDYEPWFEVCWRVDELRPPTPAIPATPAKLAAAANLTGVPVPAATVPPETPARPPQAAEFPARGQPAGPGIPPVVRTEATPLSRIWRRFRGR